MPGKALDEFSECRDPGRVNIALALGGLIRRFSVTSIAVKPSTFVSAIVKPERRATVGESRSRFQPETYD